MTTAYINKLNDFSRKFIVRGGYKPTQVDVMLFKTRLDDIKSSIFESLLLFDKTALKVEGENVPLAVLIGEVGVKGLEQLIDQDALKFIHWKSTILNFVDDQPGVIPVMHGRYQDGPYIDPEESIINGLKFLRKQPNKDQRKTIIRKVRDIYEDSVDLEGMKIPDFISSAFESGKLKSYGLDSQYLDIYKLPSDKKKILVECASDLLEYSNMIARGLTSIENSRFQSIFCDTAEKIQIVKPTDVVSVLAKIENFPDLKRFYGEIENPLHAAISLREKTNIARFRKWIESTPGKSQAEITKSYLDAISNPTGFFETKYGRLTKTIAITSVGLGVGMAVSPISGFVAPVAGVAASKLVEPAINIGIDLIDEYLISGLTKGWTPRMFFKEIDSSGIRIEPSFDLSN